RLLDIIEHHRAGTRFGIAVDPSDGLLRQGAEGYQLTWMDAKVGDWVVTPRRGKAVEINALWYHALTLTSRWVRDLKSDAEALPLARLAEEVRTSFNQRFWNPKTEALFDVVDGESGDDPSLRPNQILAVSLPNPVLDPSRWPAVVSVCDRLLFTPVGLRSLSPGSEEYCPHYIGDLTARDAAYHNGTVWAWLMGPFLDAWRKVHPNDSSGAHKRLLGFQAHLNEACVGSISEIFDAEPPFTPRGCFAQAWSVAEVLRCWTEIEAVSQDGGTTA
ncbi:MAG TPA: amylo-alpha-1,6-glucosidase, partial [Isosphaeraceae bacterium]|nr:amylo-alpha-1,6-glucosidase [Isosphaeraceae bacterium]